MAGSRRCDLPSFKMKSELTCIATEGSIEQAHYTLDSKARRQSPGRSLFGRWIPSAMGLFQGRPAWSDPVVFQAGGCFEQKEV